MTSTTTMTPGGSTGTPIVLQADAAGQPALELERLRHLSDLERTARPGVAKDRLARRIMQYVPALLDELEQAQAVGAESGTGAERAE